MHLCLYVCLFLFCLHACMYVCVYVCMFVCLHSRFRTFTWKSGWLPGLTFKKFPSRVYFYSCLESAFSQLKTQTRMRLSVGQCASCGVCFLVDGPWCFVAFASFPQDPESNFLFAEPLSSVGTWLSLEPNTQVGRPRRIAHSQHAPGLV